MNKSMKPGAAAQRPLTEEEKKSQIMRAFMQKRASLVEGILFNLCQAKDINNNTTNYECKLMVDVAIEMADHLMEKLYGAKPQDEKPKEETSVEKEREKLKGNLKEEVCASNVCAYRGKNICTIKRDEFCPMFKYKDE